MILSMLSQYARKDFIVITACCLAFYMMEFPDAVSRRTFRGIVGLFAVSLVYDVAWILINRDMEEDDSGGVEQNIIAFSMTVTYISFAFRIVFMLILHKASLDFITIVKGKSTDDKAG